MMNIKVDFRNVKGKPIFLQGDWSCNRFYAIEIGSTLVWHQTHKFLG